MGLFRKNPEHVTEVYETASGWNFHCTCGTHGRSCRSRQEMENKARWHREEAARR